MTAGAAMAPGKGRDAVGMAVVSGMPDGRERQERQALHGPDKGRPPEGDAPFLPPAAGRKPQKKGPPVAGQPLESQRRRA